MPVPKVSVIPTTGSVRFKRLRLRIVALGALVLLAFAGSSAYDAWRMYHYSLVATNRELGNRRGGAGRADRVDMAGS